MFIVGEDSKFLKALKCFFLGAHVCDNKDSSLKMKLCQQNKTITFIFGCER